MTLNDPECSIIQLSVISRWYACVIRMIVTCLGGRVYHGDGPQVVIVHGNGRRHQWGRQETTAQDYLLQVQSFSQSHWES